MDGNAEDLNAECESYEQKIKDAGGIELFVGGIGPDGHIGMHILLDWISELDSCSPRFEIILLNLVVLSLFSIQWAGLFISIANAG